LLIFTIYFTGLSSYTIILLDLIPQPILEAQGLSPSGNVFYITWMSVLFTLGVAQLYSLVGGFNKQRFKSKLLFNGFVLLLLILPGPFAESILGAFFGNDFQWYFFSSFSALGLAVFFVFRYKTSLTVYDALRSTLSVMRDVMIKTNENFVIEMIRGSYKQLLGYSQDELVGKSLSEILLISKPVTDNGETSNENIDYSQFTLTSKIKEGFFDVDVVAKDGKLIPMNFSFSPVIDNEVITGYVSIGRDFTERKLLEKELIESKKIVEHSSKLKSEFLAQISHEIRTPLNMILNSTSILRENANDKTEEELNEVHNVISDSGERIVRTIDLILNMSEIQTGTYHSSPEKFDLYKDILKVLFIEYDEKAKSKNLEFKINSKANDCTLTADNYSVTQIFSNLFDNAVKFTEKGRIDVNVYEKTGKLIVEVNDTGIGIDKDFIDDIFKPFTQQYHGYSRRYEGNGLGLALVKNYCYLNRAKIEVESEKDVGSTFRVILYINPAFS
jgi:PAS domain S-box-containing protein